MTTLITSVQMITAMFGTALFDGGHDFMLFFGHAVVLPILISTELEDVGNFVPEPMVDTGRLVCLGIRNVRLVLSERRIMGPQPSLFRKVNIEPFNAKIVVLKTGVGYKPTYGHGAKAVIRADCPGAESYNLKNYDFRRIPRPMFPLDEEIQWSPHGY